MGGQADTCYIITKKSLNVNQYGSWTEEAYEAPECAQTLDVGQTGRSVCPPPQHRTPQAAGVLAAHDLPAQPAQVRADVHGVQEDPHAAPHQGRRTGSHRISAEEAKYKLCKVRKIS